MSNNVLDENVVILRFDNSDFEKNTKQSMDTLDKLKASMGDNAPKESLKGLGKVAGSFNLDNLSRSIDTINSRFSTMGVVGMAAINKLTSAAMSSASNIISSVPKQMIQGGWKRALNIEQAEYLMKGLGYTFEGTFDKYTGKFEGIKGAVLASVNDTRYGLDEAAKAAATLLASGIDDTEELANRLKAISGVAAVTSSEYNEIAYIFTKVAGQGRMMGDELNQLSNKGFNAAAQIADYLNKNAKVKDQALDNAIALGKQSSKMAEIKEHATVTESDVREMVSAGAISFDIMSDSMLHFFDTAAGANETFEGSLANVKAAFSRMGAQVEATKLKNLTKIFNYLLPVLKKFEDFITPFTDKINTMSTAISDFIGEGIVNPIGKAIGLKPEDMFHGFAEAVEDAADSVEKSNEKAKESTESVSKEFQAAQDIWYKGTYGNGARRKSALEKLSIDYQKTQSIINAFYANGFKWDGLNDNLSKSNEDVADSTEDVADAVEDTVKTYPAMEAFVMGVIDLIASAKITIGAIGKVIKELANGIKTALSPGVKTGANLFLKFSEVVLAAAKRFDAFIDKMLYGTGKSHKAFSGFISGIKTGFSVIGSIILSVKDIVVGFFNNLKLLYSQISQSEGVIALKSELMDLAVVLKELGSVVIQELLGKLKELADTLNSPSFSGTAINGISKFTNNLADGIRGLREGVTPLKLFSDAVNSVKESTKVNKDGSYIVGSGPDSIAGKNGMVATLVSASETLGKADISKNFVSATESVNYFIDGVGKASAKSDLKGGFDGIINSFKNADWDKITKSAWRIGSLAAILQTVKDMGNLINAASGTLASMAGFFRSLSGVAMAYKQTLNVKMFETIALSIAILVGSIVALAAIPVDRLGPALIGVLAILTMVVATITFMNSSKFDPDKMLITAATFAAIGGAIMLLAIACKALSMIKPGALLKASIAIGVLIGMMVMASNYTDARGAAATFLAIGVAINLLVAAIAILALMPWGVILKGATAIALIMGELVLAAKIADTAQPAGLLAMALALDLLLPAIFVLSVMPADKALKGAIIACAVLAMIGLASKTAAGSTKTMSSMIVMSTTVSSLTAALVILSFIDPKRLLAAATALSATMVAVGLAGKTASTAKAGMALMALVIGMVGASIAVLVKLDADKAIGVAASLAALILSLSITTGILSTIGIQGALIGLAGLAIVIAGLTAIVAGLGFLNKSDKLKKKIEEGGEFLEALGTALGKFVSGIGIGMTSGMPAMAENLSSFMTSIQPFLETAKEIDTDSIQGIKDLVDAVLTLTKAEFLDKLSLLAGEKSIDDLSGELVGLADAFIAFSDKVKDIPDDTVEKTKTVAKALKALTNMVDAIPRSWGAEQLFTGWIDVDAFVDGVSSISELCVELSHLDIDALNTAKTNIEPVADIVKTMAKAADKIPESQGLKQGLLGNTTINEFAEFLALFIPSFGLFIDAVKSNDFEISDELVGEGGKIDRICKVITAMANASEEIPESFGVKQFFTGNTTINEFAAFLAASVEGIQIFINGVGPTEIDLDAAKQAIVVAKAVKAMALAAQEVPENGMSAKKIVFGGQDLGNFASQLAAFIPGFTEFSNAIGLMDVPKDIVTKTKRIAKCVDALADVADALPDSGGWTQKLLGEKDIGKFGTQLGTLMNSLAEASKNGFDDSSIKTLATTLDSLIPAIQGFKDITPIPTCDGLKQLGQNAASFAESVTGANTKGIKSKAKAIADASKTLSEKATEGLTTSSKKNDASSSGGSIADGFLKGFKNKSSLATAAGKSLANSLKKGATSISLYKSGQDVGNGFIKGIKSKEDAAYKSGRALGMKAKAGAKKALDSESPSKEFIKLGKYSGEGLVIGMKRYERKVYKSGYSIGTESVEGTKDGLSTAVFDMDDPVITPVIDLSEVDRGLNTINNEFSRNRAFGVNSQFTAADVRNNNIMTELTKAMSMLSENQNGGNINNINVTVDGAENPEEFANRFLRQLQIETRAG